MNATQNANELEKRLKVLSHALQKIKRLFPQCLYYILKEGMNNFATFTSHVLCLINGIA